MGLFDGLDLANAKDNPFETPSDWYQFICSKAVVKPNNGDKLGLNLTWTIVGGDYDGNNMLSWNRVPKVDDPEGKEKEDTKSWLKKFLLQLGFPETVHDDIEEKDFLNIRCEGMCNSDGNFTKPTFRDDKDEFTLIDNPSPLAGSDDPWTKPAG